VAASNLVNFKRMVICGLSCCHKTGTSTCSSCLQEFYCSGECQKKDWKGHKVLCKLIKLMSDVPVIDKRTFKHLLPYKEVAEIVDKVLKQTESEIVKLEEGSSTRSKKYISLLERAVKFIDIQFGNNPVQAAKGMVTYERDDGDLIYSWDVEIRFLYKIYDHLARYVLPCVTDGATKDRRDATPHLLKSFELLKPWMLQLKWLCVPEKEETLNHDMSLSEYNLGLNYKKLHDYKNAEFYLGQSILHAKELKQQGEKTLNRVYTSLQCQADLYHSMGRLPQAKTTYEEALEYTYLSENCNLEHPLFLEAAGLLIRFLGQTGDHRDAEIIARNCYKRCIGPPKDPESYEAATAMIHLALSICNLVKADPDSTDIKEAEILARGGLRLMKENEAPGSYGITLAVYTLNDILKVRKNYSDDTRLMLRDYLNDCIKYEGSDCTNTGQAHFHLGSYHYDILTTLSLREGFKIDGLSRKNRIFQARSHFMAALEIIDRTHGQNNSLSVRIISKLKELDAMSIPNYCTDSPSS
jgi:tetratricopeptide (TPR) repeat protein